MGADSEIKSLGSPRGMAGGRLENTALERRDGGSAARELKPSQKDLLLHHVCAPKFLGCSPLPGAHSWVTWAPGDIAITPGAQCQGNLPLVKAWRRVCGQRGTISPGASLATGD